MPCTNILYTLLYIRNTYLQTKKSQNPKYNAAKVGETMTALSSSCSGLYHPPKIRLIANQNPLGCESPSSVGSSGAGSSGSAGASLMSG